MKKLASLFIAVCLAVSLIAAFPAVGAMADDAAQPAAVKEVYIYNTQGWTVFGYLYDANADSGIGTEFPGTPLAPADGLGENWYVFTLPEYSAGMTVRAVFSNAGSDDVQINVGINTESIYFNTYRTYGFATAEDAVANDSEEIIEATGSTTVYFYNSRRWKTVYAYAWSADGKETQYLKKWPGTLATKDTERENWYYIVVDQDCETNTFYMIFNNGGSGGTNQAVAALITKDNMYLSFDGTAFTSYQACEEVTELLPVPEVLDPQDFYLDFTTLEAATTVSVTGYPSITASLVLLCVAGGVCAALGTVLIIMLIRRRKK